MKETNIRQQIMSLKNLLNDIQVLTMTSLQQMESLEKQFSTKEETPTEILLDEILDNEVENIVKEITRRLDKMYGSKISISVKEVK